MNALHIEHYFLVGKAFTILQSIGNQGLVEAQKKKRKKKEKEKLGPMSPQPLRLAAGEHKWTRCMKQLFHVRRIMSLDYRKTIVLWVHWLRWKTREEIDR